MKDIMSNSFYLKHVDDSKHRNLEKLSIWWLSMSKAITEFIKRCRTCNQSSKAKILYNISWEL